MLTVPEAARRVDRNPETVRRWIREGKLRARKVGTQHVIDEADLLAVIGDDEVLPVPEAWTRTITGEPMPNVVTAVRRSRAERSARLAEAIAPYLPDRSTLRDTGMAGDRWLPNIVGRIVRLVDPARIVLFGSRARGAARADSDYDLLVVVDEAPNRRQARIAIRRTLADLPVAVDIAVATADEVAGAGGHPRGALYWALAEGRTVYERA